MKEYLNLPNFLTSVRIILVPFIIFSILKERSDLAFLFLFTGCVTDLLDGFIARKLNMTTKFGAFLDPFADKFFIVPIVVVLAFKKLVPLWVTGIFIGKDLFIALSIGIIYLLRRNIPINPTFAGKSAMFLESLYLTSVLLTALAKHPLLEIIRDFFLWVSVLSVFIAAGSYIPVGLDLLKHHPRKERIR